MNPPHPLSPSSLKTRARLRWVAILVLVLGMGGAWGLYAVRTRTADLDDDLMMQGYSKKQVRQMEIMYGKMGQMTMGLEDDLKRPATQAALIAGATVVISLGCFFAATRWVDDSEPH